MWLFHCSAWRFFLRFVLCSIVETHGGRPSNFHEPTRRRQPTIGQPDIGELRQEIDPNNFKDFLDFGQFTFFYTKRFPFSNHYPCDNLHIDGRDFSCVEQYYMIQKALAFGDEETAAQILKATDPRIMKLLGKGIKNFKQNEWDEIAMGVMYDASRAKYTQNGELRDALFSTEGTVLVEANPFDRVWGIGLSMDDRRATNFGTWRGKNQLGFVLTALRKELRNDPKFNGEKKTAPKNCVEMQTNSKFEHPMDKGELKKKHTRKQRQQILQKFKQTGNIKEIQTPQKSATPSTQAAQKINNFPIPKIEDFHHLPPKPDMTISQTSPPGEKETINGRRKHLKRINRNKSPKLQPSTPKQKRKTKREESQNWRKEQWQTNNKMPAHYKEKRVHQIPTHQSKKGRRKSPTSSSSQGEGSVELNPGPINHQFFKMIVMLRKVAQKFVEIALKHSYDQSTTGGESSQKKLCVLCVWFALMLDTILHPKSLYFNKQISTKDKNSQPTLPPGFVQLNNPPNSHFGYQAFSQNQNLQEVTLPKFCETIAKYWWSQCEQILEGCDPQIKQKAFLQVLPSSVMCESGADPNASLEEIKRLVLAHLAILSAFCIMLDSGDTRQAPFELS